MHIWKCFIFIIHLLGICSSVQVEASKLDQTTLKLYVSQQFSPPGAVMNHIVVDESLGFVYVGAQNSLYQLDKTFSRLVANVTTGPVEDNECCWPFQTCYDTKELTNNINKVLLLDKRGHRLIECGSIYQGTCKTRQLSNITKVLYEISKNTELSFSDSVASNTKDGSTVAIITEGPTVNNSVIYAADTLSKSKQYSCGHENTISTHSLQIDPSRENLLFKYAIELEENNEDGSFLKLSGEYTTHYKHIFETGGKDGFVYFVLSRSDYSKTSSSGDASTMKIPYHSVVARICKSDPFYYSYTELPVDCVKDGSANLILGAYYAPDENDKKNGKLYILFQTENGSAVCVFMKQKLDQLFYRVKDICYHSKGVVNGKLLVRGLSKPPKPGEEICAADTDKPWITSNTTLDDQVVIASSVTIELPYYPEYVVPKTSILCGAWYLPHHLTSTTITTGELCFQKNTTTFSAITTTIVENHVIGLIGTKEGQILQVNLKDKTEYNVIPVGEAILPDFIWDQDADLDVPHLYVTAASKILRIGVAACEEKFTTCGSCIASGDPYCGWCILENRCSTKKQCKTALLDSTRWLNPDAKQCIYAKPPTPLGRNLNGDVTLEVNLLPVLDGDTYQCLFDDKNPSIAKVVSNENDVTILSCARPSGDHLPPNFPLQDYVNVSLSLMSNRTIPVVSTTVMFYDCNVYGTTLDIFQPCAGCLTNNWHCRWNVNHNKCFPEEIALSGSIADKKHCPTILSVSPKDKLIPVGKLHSIELSGRNLPIQEPGNYQCSVQLYGQSNSIKLDAVRSESGDKVLCDPHIYTYAKNIPEAKASIKVTWKLTFVVDYQDLNNSTITFYKCNASRGDCSQCVTADPKFDCGWCKTTKQCTIRDSCSDIDWITDGLMCPVQQITGFSPSSGPPAGGTLIRIFGTNMGTSVSDIQRITVGKAECVIERGSYVISIKVACTVSSVSGPTSARIAVTVKNQTRYSTDPFIFRIPKLTGVSPMLGPQAGGTLITISGIDMNTGSRQKVFIGNNNDYSCALKSVQSDALTCLTSQSHNVLPQQDITVSFDNYETKLNRVFSYNTNPVIRGCSTLTPGGELTSFLSGGRNISVKGANLNSVEEPLLIVSLFEPSARRKRTVNPALYALARAEKNRNAKRRRRSISQRGALPANVIGTRISSKCDVFNSTFMMCYSPPITSDGNVSVMDANISDSVYWESRVVFKMDNLEVPYGKVLAYYPNPQFQRLRPDTAKKAGLFLEIEVFNLNGKAITKNEVYVMIGSKRCVVASLESNKLLCTVPPQDGDYDGKVYPVTVRIGHNNKPVDLGNLKYPVAPPLLGTSALIIIIVVGVLVFFIISGVVAYFVRKNKHYKADKNDYLKAMENMEMSVRADFRKAFAELNVDMSDLTADIDDFGIPCLDYRTYVTNLFFPSFKYHPCMKQPDSDSKLPSTLEQGLNQFLLLLSNRNFLSVFIHTLEEQKSFSNRDKGNVASLLTVALHNKLDYFTEIMKSLVSDLISVNVQRNPKLILRRSDSVAERMLSNWMYICLYPYLRDKAGNPIFLLLKAIKQQVSKGPVDAITGKARYTLSDDRLLQEDVANEVMTLFITPSSNNDDEPVIVKILNCDSIAQVKEKVMDAVYKRMPFSQRPRADQLDLEWRHGRSGHLVLPNQDYVTEQGSRWRRLMTIVDYKVANNATLALIPKQLEFEGSQDMSSIMSNNSNETSPLSPMLHEDGNSKMYHLVKYNDDNEVKRESTINRDRHKHIADLYLLRLINMKGILQTYVDKVMNAILDTSSIPCPVKHFFHLLDDIAAKLGINDPEVLHIWKTNSLHNRFWVTILKNPEYVFDIEKPDTIASTMAVISQTFIDACSVTEHKPTKDSPINKQLYAKEIPTYKNKVQEYYRVIKEQPAISDQDVNAYIAGISRDHGCEFDVNVALKELWGYLSKYYEEVNESLENDVHISPAVIQKLQQTYNSIDSAVNGV